MNDKVKKATALKLEDGIPIPQALVTPGLLEIMKTAKVGQSFLVNIATQSVYNIAFRLKPKKFSCRRQPDGSTRVWRIE
jgi:hypothetical protein